MRWRGLAADTACVYASKGRKGREILKFDDQAGFPGFLGLISKMRGGAFCNCRPVQGQEIDLLTMLTFAQLLPGQIQA